MIFFLFRTKPNIPIRKSIKERFMGMKIIINVDKYETFLYHIMRTKVSLCLKGIINIKIANKFTVLASLSIVILFLISKY